MRVAVAFSGGRDSTAALLQALREGYSVHAHTCIVPQFGLPAVLQRDAARDIITEIASPFLTHTESVHHLPEVPDLGFVMATVYSMLLRFKCSELWTGADVPKNSLQLDHTRQSMHDPQGSHVAPVLGLSIQEVIDVINNPKIERLTWSCEFPKVRGGDTAVSCMEDCCPTCQDYIKESGKIIRERKIDWDSLRTLSQAG